MFIPNHKHLIVNAQIKNPILDPQKLKTWLEDLVNAVDMKVFFGPEAKLCDYPGNEGVTGLVCLETSHASLHEWSQVDQPYFTFDLYSCRDFHVDIPINMIIKDFDPKKIDWMLIDRNNGLKVIDQGIVEFE